MRDKCATIFTAKSEYEKHPGISIMMQNIDQTSKQVKRELQGCYSVSHVGYLRQVEHDC